MSQVTAIVRKCGSQWCLYSHEGKRLGTHRTKEDAIKQEQAIQINKAKGSVAVVLTEVARELQRRRSPVAPEVLAAAQDLLEDLDAQLKRAGFENPMKRDEDVAQEIQFDKIPILPPLDETAQ